MSEQGFSPEGEGLTAPVESISQRPSEFLFSYKISQGKEKELSLIALDEEEKRQSEQLIAQALARDPRNLRKDRLYLADYLFTKLVVQAGMPQEEFGDLWLKSAKELYHLADGLAKGKSYQEVDYSPVLLGSISDPGERQKMEKAFKDQVVSVDDFRVKVKTESGETKPGRLLSGKQAVARFEKIQRRKEGRKKEERPEIKETREDEVRNEIREVKRYSLLRRVLSLGPRLAERFDLTKKVEKWGRRHPNAAFVLGGAALLAIAADLQPQQASDLVKQGLETVDIFIKNQGWQLTPLGQRAVELIGGAMPQVEAFAQHQSLLLNLSDYVARTDFAQEVEKNIPAITRHLQESWGTLATTFKGIDLNKFSQEVGDFFTKVSQEAASLKDPQIREKLVKKLAEEGINSFNFGLDLVAKGVAEAKDYLSQLAHQWGLTKDFYYSYPRQSA